MVKPVISIKLKNNSKFTHLQLQGLKQKNMNLRKSCNSASGMFTLEDSIGLTLHGNFAAPLQRDCEWQKYNFSTKRCIYLHEIVNDKKMDFDQNCRSPLLT